MNMIDKSTTMDACIKSLPSETREILQKIREIGHKVVPESTETVSYGMPTLKLSEPIPYDLNEKMIKYRAELVRQSFF